MRSPLSTITASMTDPTSVHALPHTGLSRRRFIQAAVASAAVGVSVPAWMRDAWAAPQLSSSDGILVVVTLRGGVDPLTVLVPRQGVRRAHYEAARGEIALPAADLLTVDNEFGFSPRLTSLADRYAAGKVAVVQGVALADPTRSHFRATARMESANTADPSTGWLGRYIDNVGTTGGVTGVTISPGVPLHMRGHRDGAVALPLGSILWGSDTSKSYERAALDAMRDFAAAPTGLGQWGDEMAHAGMMAIDQAAVVGPLATAAPSSANQIARSLETAALTVNADIGARVLAVEIGGYDTHAGQAELLSKLLAQLDAAIDRFFATLEPARHPQVAMLIVSEFGRRVAANSSRGTDHGNAGLNLLIGDNVNGGLHGEHPSLVDLDPNGNLAPAIDHREVYATVLEQWIGGDANAVLGRTFSHLDLLAAGPGQ